MTAAKKALQLSFLLLPILCATAVPLDQATAAKRILYLSSQVKFLTRELLNCKYSDKFDLRLRQFQDRNITCNDGTTAGYYIKRSYQSNKWIIYLEGGLYCFNDQSCTERMNSPMRELMTSSHWLPKRRGTGILSPNAEENPTWWNANHVYVPYCSSDAWSGNVSSVESGGKFSFMGNRIIDEVIKELLPQGLLDSKQLLFAGSSAGGIGVIMNIDRVADMMAAAGSSVEVRGLSDSGWYIEGKTSDLSKCKNNQKDCVKPSDVIVKGIEYWKGVVPKKCAEEFAGESWRCYFGHNVYRTLSSPLFIFQWQYDQTQMIVENPATGMRGGIKTGKKLIGKLATDIKKSLNSTPVRAFFLPACLSHAVLTNSNWLSVKVKGYSLNDAINCWLIRGSQTLATSSPNLWSSHCKSRLMDDCTYPQCNQWCPVVRHPFTGNIMAKPKLTLPLQGIPISPRQRNSSQFQIIVPSTGN